MLKRILNLSLYGVGTAMVLVILAWAANKGFDLGWFSNISASKLFFSLAMLVAMLFLAQILAPLLSNTRLSDESHKLVSANSQSVEHD